MNFCTMHAFHPEYAQHIYDQMESVGWRDAQGRLVTNWQSHAKNKFKYQNQFLESLKHEKRKSNFTSTGDKVGGIYRQIAEQAY